MNRGFGLGGGRLATRRRSSSGHPRICVSGGCRVESDGVAQTPVSGSWRSRSSNPTIASESETIEWFRRGSRIGEIELSRLDERFELWLTTRLLHFHKIEVAHLLAVVLAIRLMPRSEQFIGPTALQPQFRRTGRAEVCTSNNRS